MLWLSLGLLYLWLSLRGLMSRGNVLMGFMAGAWCAIGVKDIIEEGVHAPDVLTAVIATVATVLILFLQRRSASQVP